MISGTADDYVPQPQAEIIDAQDRTVLRTGIPMEAEMEVQRLDGEKVFSMITRFPVLDSVGHVIGIGGIHMNISEIKEKERQIRIARDEAERDNHDKSPFHANMRNPLHNPTTRTETT